MDTRLFARIGAGAFVAAALTMSAFQLHEERAAPTREVVTFREPDGNPLTGQLRACAAIGERALASPGCRNAWAEKRRRFLRVEDDTSDPGVDANAAPARSFRNPPAKGL